MYLSALYKKRVSCTAHRSSQTTPVWNISHQRYHSTVLQETAITTGLFGIHGLKAPEHWKQVAQEALQKSESYAKQIKANELPPRDALRALDNISETICKVVDPAEVCRNVHPEPAWREAADEVVSMLSSYIHNLNANRSLYTSVLNLTASSVFSQLTPEETAIATHLKEEFEVQGIHLPEIKRQQVVALQEKISNTVAEFMHAAQAPNQKQFQVKSALLVDLPESVKKKLPKIRDTYTLSADSHTTDSVLKWVFDPNVRKQAFFAANSCEDASRNLTILDELLRSRDTLAKLLEFPSYAHMTLANNRIAKSPESVKSFLLELSSKLKDKAEQEMSIVRKEKLLRENTSHIYGWDSSYYMGLTKAKRHNLDSHFLNQHFSLNNCMNGLNIIVSKLFGLSLKQIPMDKKENWHPSVRKIQVTHETEGPIGFIYADLFSRANKFAHAATFAINFPKVDEGNNLIEIPRIALVCSFTSDPRNSTPLLSHGEAETLFHEFGHCLSALLSRTRFQHASGTRSALDFVETPSTLMEYFIWDPRVLKLFAKHYQTGADLPDEVLANLCASQHMFSALDAQQQLTYSLFDMAVHGPHPLKQSTTDILKDMQNKHWSIPFVEGTCWHARFGHLTGYGAGYYSYLFCRVFSANIWRKCFSEDPLNREAGEKYRREILQYGGVKDPNMMFEALLGQKPNIDNFLKQIKAS